LGVTPGPLIVKFELELLSRLASIPATDEALCAVNALPLEFQKNRRRQSHIAFPEVSNAGLFVFGLVRLADVLNRGSGGQMKNVLPQ
jgi:hypothetical protein